MKQLEIVLQECLNIDFMNAIISNPRLKSEILRIKVRPILQKGELFFQCESYSSTQVFHKNLDTQETISCMLEWMKHYKQMQIETKALKYHILISKKGKVTIQKKQQLAGVKEVSLEHNKKKSYILKEGICIPFLQDLGVMTKEGKVVKSKFDKFRQINRFLEFVEDILPQLSKEKELTILDFGCGKSYLTFAIYYYLHVLNGYDIRLIGLDLKEEVIARCNALSEKYGYEKLIFLKGNIADYTGVEEVDMVVTLHACDTATDYAIAKAIEWNAKVILSVPCCQHELNDQIKNEVLQPVLQYGLIKERMSSLITDAVRAEILVHQGYDAQILEFIDMEHTPKNILIRAMKTGQKKKNDKELKALLEFLNIHPMLQRLLKDKGDK
ncbi:class I SAM-dependent methyltransferase [Lachnospiraceae bacterium LCP25S3_G4]